MASLRNDRALRWMSMKTQGQDIFSYLVTGGGQNGVYFGYRCICMKIRGESDGEIRAARWAARWLNGSELGALDAFPLFFDPLIRAIQGRSTIPATGTCAAGVPGLKARSRGRWNVIGDWGSRFANTLSSRVGQRPIDRQNETPLSRTGRSPIQSGLRVSVRKRIKLIRRPARRSRLTRNSRHTPE